MRDHFLRGNGEAEGPIMAIALLVNRVEPAMSLETDPSNVLEEGWHWQG
jgi:hypothetical protein